MDELKTMFPRLLVLFFCVMILNLAAKPKFTKRLIGMCALISTIGGQPYVRRHQGLCLCQRSHLHPGCTADLQKALS